MPHYKDGREAKAGDTVKIKVWCPKAQKEVEKTGIVQEIFPSSDTCNAQVSYQIVKPSVDYATVTLKDTELLFRPDDAAPEA